MHRLPAADCHVDLLLCQLISCANFDMLLSRCHSLRGVARVSPLHCHKHTRPPCLYRGSLLADTAGRSGSMHALRSQEKDGSQETSTSGSDGPGGPDAPRPAPRPAPATTSVERASASLEEAEEAEEQLRTVWADLKASISKTVGPEEATMLESINYDDIMGGTDKLLKKVVAEQLGPVLQQAGVTDEPFEFFVDLVKMATFIQLVTCGALFYSTELWGHYDTGEAFRAVAGLSLGYVLRVFFRVEQLLWPVYNWGIKLVAADAEYQVTSASQEEVQATLNKLGILVAVAFLLPQALLHWDVAEVVQLVAPMAIGIFLFDVVYMTALVAKLKLF